MTKTQVIYRQKQRQRKRENFIEKLIVICFVLVFLTLYIDFLRFPECYLTTWKYQLKNEILAGDQEAITYYQTHYTKYNRSLFDD